MHRWMLNDLADWQYVELALAPFAGPEAVLVWAEPVGVLVAWVQAREVPVLWAEPGGIQLFRVQFHGFEPFAGAQGWSPGVGPDGHNRGRLCQPVKWLAGLADARPTRGWSLHGAVGWVFRATNCLGADDRGPRQ